MRASLPKRCLEPPCNSFAILMRGGLPEGGEWNLDKQNRKPFGTTEVLVGSWGARSSLDGLEGV